MTDQPIDVVLHCPKCALQHIDAPEPEQELTGTQHEIIDGRLTATPYTYRGRPAGAWTNPPHKSHLCAGCGHVWRPSDHPTNGVLRTASGKDADCVPFARMVRGVLEVGMGAHGWKPGGDGYTYNANINAAAYDAIAGKPDEWTQARDICNAPDVDEAIRNLVEDSTMDNAVCVVRAVLRAKP